ncbi:MAG: preprotein translocase subunit SecA [Methanopyri archaeon]|nr:preprotein translocase subunit SecA [Methanopyri archaeon]
MEDGLFDRFYDGVKSFFSYNHRELRRLDGIVEEVNGYADEMSALSDEDLAGKTGEFRDRYAAGESLDDIMPEAYAAVREASSRVTGMRHYNVQIRGGVIIHEGRIAEMQTGEGKTLVATLPAYLHAIEGKGVHVITANDYLAERDAKDMAPIYEFMGMSVGCIQHDESPEDRKAAYRSDITYGTNNEFGFDHLKDTMVRRPEDRVMRGMHYAIIDEVDSILIDEGRTPLIISGRTGTTAREYLIMDRIVRDFEPGRDYEVHEKDHLAFFTERGDEKLAKALGVDSPTDERTMHLYHSARQCIAAHSLFTKDKNYVVSDGELLIVDEFTGRLMHGRRYEAGLHEALEAKEANNDLLATGKTDMKVREPSQTYASITFPNFFRMYDRVSGMTGTAKTEEGEFISLYGMDVSQMPTNEPMQRDIQQDLVYRTAEEKYDAIVEDIVAQHEAGRPVLVGTRSIDVSEHLSDMLIARGIDHRVLHAKHHKQEADIIAQAGQKGAVTVATNMAGRGTDIKLGEGVADIGGLHVIGSERHDSRRIDDQLLGREGRQGDPGSCRFYLSAEDELLRFYGPDNMEKFFSGVHKDEPLSGKLIDKIVRKAQVKVEGMHFEMRKNLLKYDEVMNTQREIFYDDRNVILERPDLKQDVYNVIERTAEEVVESFAAEGPKPHQWENEFLEKQFAYNCQALFGIDVTDLNVDTVKNADELTENLTTEAMRRYHKREAEIGTEVIGQVERQVLLHSADMSWKDHLLGMDEMKRGVHLRAYAQQDPFIEYQTEAFHMYQGMQSGIRWQATRSLFHFQITKKEEDTDTSGEGVPDGAEAAA